MNHDIHLITGECMIKKGGDNGSCHSPDSWRMYDKIEDNNESCHSPNYWRMYDKIGDDNESCHSPDYW